MKKRLLGYIDYVEKELAKEDLDRETFREQLLIQIQFFQHERLIHLIVTVTFALLLVTVFGLFLLTEIMSVLALGALILVLLVPYISHYYLLENGVQKLYGYYDKVIDKEFLKGSI